MPPAGKAFAVIETNRFRTRNGMIIEHWANRRPRYGPAGWIGTPSPISLLRTALAKRRAQIAYSEMLPCSRRVLTLTWLG
jgi:hypothetical protein